MIRILLMIVVLAGICGKAGAADNANGIGIGLALGDPTGVAAKVWIDREHAVDVMLGIGSENMHADYLWHKFDALKVERGRLPLYFGIGAAARFDDDPQLGVRAPVGLAYLLPQDPIDVFLELAPVFYLVTHADFDLTLSLGVRVFFQ